MSTESPGTPPGMTAPYRALVVALLTPGVALALLPLLLVAADTLVTGVAGGLLALGWLLGVPALHRDAVAVSRACRDGVGDAWRPSPARHALAGLLGGPLAVGYYLRQRHRHLGTHGGWGGWWLLVPAGLIGFGALVAVLTVAPDRATAGPLLAVVALCYACFPVAVYGDARVVRAGAGDWNPDPAATSLAASASVATLVLPPVVALAYLGQRARTAGVGG